MELNGFAFNCEPLFKWFSHFISTAEIIDFLGQFWRERVNPSMLNVLHVVSDPPRIYYLRCLVNKGKCENGLNESCYHFF